MARTYDTTLTLVRDDGREWTFDGSPWALAERGMDAFNPVAVDVKTSALVLDDGSAVTNERFPECHRTFEAICIMDDADGASAERYRALAFLAPHHTYELHVAHRGVERWCEGMLEGVDCKLREGRFAVELMATFLCPDPWMMDEDGNESAFGDAVAAFGWPFVSYVDDDALPRAYPAGWWASTLIYDGENTVWNNGDAPCGYKVVYTASGYIENPTLTKDGKQLRIEDTMQAGDVTVIDFAASPPTVTKNGDNIIQQCSRDSSFTGMQMHVGKNVFTVEVDNTGNRSLLEVQVLFHKRRAGV